MSIPWFPFNIKDFVANTLRLNTEAKGAYLCLMLDYYQGEQALPDDDDVLASITGLTPEAWQRHRKVLAPLFEVADGVWRHRRIEEEITIAKARMAMAKEKATHAANVRHSHKDAPSKQRAKPRASPKNTHLHKHTTTLSSSSGAPARENDDATKAHDQIEEGKTEPTSGNPLGTQLPADWTPSEPDIEAAKAYGLSLVDIEAELLLFHAYNSDNGHFSKNWSSTWQLWCARWKARNADKAKARVEVDTKPFEPSPKDWRGYCDMWRRQKHWPRGVGPDPDSPSCKCPTAILNEFGLRQKPGEVA